MWVSVRRKCELEASRLICEGMHVNKYVDIFAPAKALYGGFKIGI